MMARPRGTSDRRSAIVASATRLFARDGYDGVSLRQIAREAGVDAALVHHYFTGKEELFAASVELPIDPETILSGLYDFAPGDRGRFVAHAIVRLWEGPQQHALAAFFRSTISSTARSRLLADLVRRRILARIVEGIPGDDAERELRASLAATQVVGFMIARYIVRLEPLASLPADEAEAFLAPAIQRHLTEPLPIIRSQTGSAQKSTVAKVPTRSNPTRS
ncbi:TetR family transcriptional regulator [Sinomonas sp. JGH33]|uniref:TetR family transcriptional regulator n=1 Tax=Sinomonas terricola TaxID=3110330 RepID=A0ABU5T4S6_9MICC|nr:TetR family transcriptional regulator [Sinomonas sp. JGH33]MEA5454598.1 TetR family transcriptional regulator [Sinomonas sp. JGH33]